MISWWIDRLDGAPSSPSAGTLACGRMDASTRRREDVSTRRRVDIESDVEFTSKKSKIAKGTKKGKKVAQVDSPILPGALGVPLETFDEEGADELVFEQTDRIFGDESGVYQIRIKSLGGFGCSNPYTLTISQNNFVR